MTNEDMLREFTELPPEEKRVVADLISFLRNRYLTAKEVPASNLTDIVTDSAVGMWRDREEMKESAEWVRKARKDEWGG